MQLVTAARGARRLESPLSAAAQAPRCQAQRDKSVRLSLLNAFALVCDGVTIELPLTAQRLLAFVALHDHPLQRAYVSGVLWADSTQDRAAGSLRSSLWRLHRPGYQLIDASSTHLHLADGVEVDVRRGLAHARGLLAGADVDGDDAALHGELLPDWYDDWVLFERERFRQLALHALEAQAERLLELGRPLQALEGALAAVRSEPLRESAHRLLIRVHLAEGNAVEALRQFELCRRLLRDRLGLDPSPQLVELVASLTR
jgi:DNA-binding SARP family transcriptional activator